MPQPMWDASALAKRYALEIGSETVDTIFEAVFPVAAIATFLSYAETFSLLQRKHNRGDMSLQVFFSAVLTLQAEVFDSQGFLIQSISDLDIVQGIEYIGKHNINASDAAILAAYLRYSQVQPHGSPRCGLIASDQRLLRAAVAEGLATLKPETFTPQEVPEILADF